MKTRASSGSFISIEWNGRTIDGQVFHNPAELEELARELGRLAARRDLAAARANAAKRCLGSDDMISTISAKTLN